MTLSFGFLFGLSCGFLCWRFVGCDLDSVLLKAGMVGCWVTLCGLGCLWWGLPDLL